MCLRRNLYRGASAVVSANCFADSVETDQSSVGKDPLGSGVAEGDSDADDGVRVVRANHTKRSFRHDADIGL
jgi:hypothetical protein